MVAQTEPMALTRYEGGALPAIVRPLTSAAEAAAAIQEFEDLKVAIVRKSDVQVFKDKKSGEERRFLKKKFWRRVATVFGLSLIPESESRGFDEGGHLYYSVVYRAVAPNGRVVYGDGYCSTAESGKDWWGEHNIRATAHTRAKNRAISDMVGGGEVSAEEVGGDEDEPEAKTERTPRHQLPAGRQAAPTTKQAATAPAAITEDEMTAMSDRFKAVSLRRPQVEAFVRTHCGEGKGYNKALTRADWTKLDKALKAYEAKMARLTGASGTVADAAAAVTGNAADYVDADPAPVELDLTGEAEDAEQGA